MSKQITYAGALCARHIGHVIEVHITKGDIEVGRLGRVAHEVVTSALNPVVWVNVNGKSRTLRPAARVTIEGDA